MGHGAGISVAGAIASGEHRQNLSYQTDTFSQSVDKAGWMFVKGALFVKRTV